MDVHGLESFLLTYGGLAAIVAVLIEIIKLIHKPLVDKKEPMIAVALVLVLGVVVKLSPDVPGYKDLSWVAHILALVITGALSGLGHDKIIEPGAKGIGWAMKLLGLKKRAPE